MYNLDELISTLINIQEELEDMGKDTNPEVEIHTQKNWPLKSNIVNIRILGDTVAIAMGTCSEYGNKLAWTDDPEVKKEE